MRIDKTLDTLRALVDQIMLFFSLKRNQNIEIGYTLWLESAI